MNGAHFHLMVNHIPIIGTIAGMFILLAGIVVKNSVVKQTGLATLIASALSIIIVLLSGDPAGEAVEGIGGVSEAMIEHHESVAYGSLWIMVPMGLLASLAFYSLFKKERTGNTLSLITFILSLITIGMMSWVGLTGGEIRHTEIRSDSTSVSPAGIQDSDDD